MDLQVNLIGIINRDVVTIMMVEVHFTFSMNRCALSCNNPSGTVLDIDICSIRCQNHAREIPNIDSGRPIKIKDKMLQNCTINQIVVTVLY